MAEIQITYSPRWVRCYKDKQLIADSQRVKLVIIGHGTAYFFPAKDLKVDPKTIPGHTQIEELSDHYTFEWGSMDHWFEEEEEIFIHPRNPYHRVDCIASSRHVQVRIGDTLVAETHKPVLLFETSLPTRYYIPPHDCRLDLLEPSETTSGCPYKGIASYYNIRIDGKLYSDHLWYYKYPLIASLKVQGLFSFYNEHVDITLDGIPMPRPQSPA